MRQIPPNFQNLPSAETTGWIWKILGMQKNGVVKLHLHAMSGGAAGGRRFRAFLFVCLSRLGLNIINIR